MSAIWTALLSIITRLVASVATKQFLEWALFYIAERIVKHTKTKQDDVWFAEIKAAYDRYDLEA